MHHGIIYISPQIVDIQGDSKSQNLDLGELDLGELDLGELDPGEQGILGMVMTYYRPPIQSLESQHLDTGWTGTSMLYIVQCNGFSSQITSDHYCSDCLRFI